MSETETDRVPYAPHDDYVVARAFTYNGRQWSPGERFPWRTIACGEPDLLYLWNQRMVERVPEGGADVQA